MAPTKRTRWWAWLALAGVGAVVFYGVASGKRLADERREQVNAAGGQLESVTAESVRDYAKEASRDMERNFDAVKGLRAEMHLIRFGGESTPTAEYAAQVDGVIATLDAGMKELRWIMDDMRDLQRSLSRPRTDLPAAHDKISEHVENFRAVMENMHAAMKSR